jgi:hypothetical protein
MSLRPELHRRIDNCLIDAEPEGRIQKGCRRREGSLRLIPGFEVRKQRTFRNPAELVMAAVEAPSPRSAKTWIAAETIAMRLSSLFGFAIRSFLYTRVCTHQTN